MGRRSGLVRRPGVPSGLDGRLVMLVDMRILPLVSIMGEECALVMRGALRAVAEDRDRRWLRENGERLRVRIGNVPLPVSCDAISEAGSVDRRVFEGLVFGISGFGICSVSEGSPRISKVGVELSAGNDSILGTIAADHVGPSVRRLAVAGTTNVITSTSVLRKQSVVQMSHNSCVSSLLVSVPVRRCYSRPARSRIKHVYHSTLYTLEGMPK